MRLIFKGNLILKGNLTLEERARVTLSTSIHAAQKKVVKEMVEPIPNKTSSHTLDQSMEEISMETCVF